MGPHMALLAFVELPLSQAGYILIDCLVIVALSISPTHHHISSILLVND
jgi:hypothetical protein